MISGSFEFRVGERLVEAKLALVFIFFGFHLNLYLTEIGLVFMCDYFEILDFDFVILL
jgi:hypothetical protein